MKKLISLLILTVIAGTAFCKTITVTSSADSGAGTLRQAVTDAESGDIIVFDEDITIIYFSGVIKLDKNITISGNETNNTTFQNAAVWTDNVNRKRYFEIAANAIVTFNHLTLKNHVGGCSGGAILNQGNLTLNNCTFSNISNPYHSGGAILNTGVLNVENCIFSNNTSALSSGAIDGNSGKLSIVNSRFIGNYVPKVNSGSMCPAGAISINDNVTASISNCIFEENIASEGGAIRNSGTTIINNCTFKKNKSTMGGAISNMNQISISNSIFLQNEANRDGIFSSRPYYVNTERSANSIARLVNCLFIDNIITESSSSIISHSYGNMNTAQLTLINCTVADNTGTGISYQGRNSTTELYNTILWNNVSNLNNQYDVYKATSTENSSVFNAYNSFIGTSNIDLSGNNNIIGEDPFFVGNGDYSLQENSPAIDAGNNSYYSYNEFPKDLANNYRIDNTTIDLGAYEYQTGNPITGIPLNINKELKIYTQNQTIIIENNAISVNVFDIMGRSVAKGTGNEFVVPQGGIYLVKVGNITQKIVVK